MRIAIIADPIDNQHAGIHVYTREMTDALIRTNPGHEIVVVRERKDSGMKGAEQIAVWNTRLPVGFASLRLFFIIPFLMFLRKADAVIEPAHFGPFNLQRRVKRVTIIHDLTPILFPKLHRWHSQFLQRLFLKGILNRATLIIANSDNTQKDICRVYPNNCDKVKRIYPGIGDEFKPEQDDEVLKKHKITGPYFLFVGTIEPRKNLTVMLDAFAGFCQRSDKAHMLVIAGGQGWKSKSFFEKLKVHPFRERIRITGYIGRDELPALYSKATAFIYPSMYEGFGMPIAEAMKCGTPVIAADNSSLREAGGIAAMYFDTADALALADKMMKLADEDNRPGERIRQMAEHVKKFNWDNFAVEMWKSLEAVCAK